MSTAATAAPVTDDATEGTPMTMSPELRVLMEHKMNQYAANAAVNTDRKMCCI